MIWYALRICAASVLIAGCGALPQTEGDTRPAFLEQPQDSRTWMLPVAKREDLLYVSKLKNVIVYSYPSARVVGNLAGFGLASGLCSDRRGDVWITDNRTLEISEYAHAGTKPIAVLDAESEPVACAVDPLSGDLAVANYTDNISVYPHATGRPKIYTAPDFSPMQFCTYDGSGNLFVDGYRNHKSFVLPGVLKLSYGGMQLQRFKLEGRRRKGRHSPGGMQWDGGSLIIGSEGKYGNKINLISDLGHAGRIVREIHLTVPSPGYFPADYPLIVHNDKVIATYDAPSEQHYIAFWPYPEGGTAIKEFKVRGKFFPAGIAVSVAGK